MQQCDKVDIIYRTPPIPYPHLSLSLHLPTIFDPALVTFVLIVLKYPNDFQLGMLPRVNRLHSFSVVVDLSLLACAATTLSNT